MSAYDELRQWYENFLDKMDSENPLERYPFNPEYEIKFPHIEAVETVFISIAPPKNENLYFYNPTNKIGPTLKSRLLPILSVNNSCLRDKLGEGGREMEAGEKAERERDLLHEFLKRYYLTDAYKFGEDDTRYENEEKFLLEKEISVLKPGLIVTLGKRAFYRIAEIADIDARWKTRKRSTSNVEIGRNKYNVIVSHFL